MADQATVLAASAARLEDGGRTVMLPLVEGSEGERSIDITQLRSQTGLITFDPGFGNTGACKSRITFIDGERGILRHRGYPIEALAEQSTFLEVAWLLIHGELPTPVEADSFSDSVAHHTMLHEDVGRFFDSLPKDAHPMPVCAAAVGALATFYQQPETDRNIREAVTRLMAKMPTIAAYSKDKKSDTRLSGFGHRVYKNFDPRATILKKASADVLNTLGVSSRQLEIAMKLEETALRDDYFISHKLYPNVDFYSGIIYKALGIPVNMFTVMFTIGRLPGWMAHWIEMRNDPDTRFARPRQIYTGETERVHTPMTHRVRG